jgi:hypothetical protein
MPYTLPSINLTNQSNGLEQLFIYEATQVDILIPSLLFFIFVSIMAGGYYSQQRRLGEGSLSMWSAIAGYITSILSFVLFLYNGLISLNTVIIIMAITFLCTIWFLLSREEF